MRTRTEGDRAALVVADLFCGAGGLSQGFADAGWTPAYAVDQDADSCATYKLNHPAAHIERASITDVDADSIRRAVGGDRRIDLVVGGPSCQGFSTASRRSDKWFAEDDERNALWTHMHKLVEGLRPRAFLMENVPGLTQWKKNELGRRILQGYRDIGYTVTAQTLLAANYGVPQLRRRVFLVGLLGDRAFTFPEPTHLGAWRRDQIDRWERERVERRLLSHITAGEALADLPLAADGPTRWCSDARGDYARRMREGADVLTGHEVPKTSEAHLQLLRHVPQGGTWRDIPSHLLPGRFLNIRRTDSTGLLGRVDPHRPSYTITTQFSNVTGGTFAHPTQDRVLSLREGARLQSFPDRYDFVGPLSSRYRQVGNAVPPLLATVLADCIAEQIDGRRRPDRTLRPLPAPVRSHLALPLPRAAGRDEAAHHTLRALLDDRGVCCVTSWSEPVELERPPSFSAPDQRLAVYVDGCFMHGCQQHSGSTKSSTKWWAGQIALAQARTLAAVANLRGAGWTVVRVWEHETPAAGAEAVLEAIATDAAPGRDSAAG